MTRTYVALDLETTGLDPDRDRITEVGAVRFAEDGTVVDTFERLVNPGRPIPLFIQQLTGITEADVAGAPPLAEIVPELTRFVDGSIVVGQNVRFDLGCLRRERVDLGVPGIDTVQMSRLLLPHRQPRNLVDLAAGLGVEAGEHHRALPDARTAAAIFVALRRHAETLAPELRGQLARLVGLNDLPLAEAIAGEDWRSLPITERQIPSVRPAPEFPALVKREPRVPVLASEVGRAFDVAAGALERFEHRSEQREMAAAVCDAMADGGHWLIEAGTGVGKSLAYLVPAALHALRNGERVVISTNTINLQEQLLRKDIPALRSILRGMGAIKDDTELRATVLKGRSNYLCFRRWVAGYGQGMGDPDFARLGAAMLLWLPETETGDRSELSLDSAEWQAWPRFSAQDTDCLTRQSQWVRNGSCFLQRARKAAEAAHIIIVNHALLLADIASHGSAIPAYDHLIVDEAHNLEDQATKQFGGTVSRRLLLEALDGLHRPRGREGREGGVATLLRALPEGAAHAAGVALENGVAAAVPLIAPFFEALAGHLPGAGEDDALLIGKSVRARPEWLAVDTAWGALDKALQQTLSAGANAAKTVLDSAPIEEPDILAGEIESAARRVDEFRSLMAELLSRTGEEQVVWAARESDRTASLNSAPLDVGPTLWEELFSKRRTVVATSATLATAGSMEFAARRLGLEGPRMLQLGSPFDYESSTLLAAFTDVPEPNDPGYLDAVASAVTRLVQASDGRALVLFTSHSALQQVVQRCRGPLEDGGIVVLAQKTDGSPRQLTENLIANPRTAVFGTQSFWEGVDIRGDALSMLIIARLPFSPPTDPVHRARSEQYDDPFGQYSLPAAILRFRQGFGRLIRDREDRGVVAVLDRRIYEKRYGAQFVAALPRCTMVRADAETVAARAAEWLER
ncbi:MAG: 3'-5' exoribonuclease [Chloroflexi bacterium]|nr:3'-5' exoribonuclease [Chloroflexota bacterium]